MVVEYFTNHNNSPEEMSDPLKLILLMDPAHYNQKPVKKKQEWSRQHDSISFSLTAAADDRITQTMKSMSMHHGDRRRSSRRSAGALRSSASMHHGQENSVGRHREDKDRQLSSSSHHHFTKQLSSMAQIDDHHREQKSRPDPPEYVHRSNRRTRSSKNIIKHHPVTTQRPSETNRRDRSNTLGYEHDQQQPPSAPDRSHRSSKRRELRQTHRRHNSEGVRQQYPEVKSLADAPNTPPRSRGHTVDLPLKSNEPSDSPRSSTRRRQQKEQVGAAAEDASHARPLDDFERHLQVVQLSPSPTTKKRRHRRRKHPAKSSSFQAHPSQLLQVYKDLGASLSGPKRSSTLAFEGPIPLRSSTGGIKEESCSPHQEEGPMSSSLPITSHGEFLMDSFKVYESHSQADEDEGDTDSLAVLRNDGDSIASQDFDIATDNSKASTKVHFNSRQGSMEGVRTLATVASSTASISTLKTDLRTSAGSGATENRSVFGFHSEDDDNDESADDNDFIHYLFGTAKYLEESSGSHQDQGGDDHLHAKEDAESTKDTQESTPPHQEKTPRRCTINSQLLQKQIKYLQQDSEPLLKSKSEHTTGSSNAASSRQLIIYQHDDPSSKKKRDKDLVEETLTLIRRRRDIMHKRNSHNRVRKTYSSRSSSRHGAATRRLSF